MNIAKGIFLLFFCTLAGYMFSLKYKNKRVFYVCFKRFNEKLKSEISFNKGSIINLLEEQNFDNDFYNFMKNYYKNNQVIFEKNYLSDDEKNFLYEYVMAIGFSDGVSQLQYLENIGKEIDEKRLYAIDNEKRYKTLYIKLGILIGIILMIIVL